MRSAVAWACARLDGRTRDALVGALALGQLESGGGGARTQVGSGVRTKPTAQLRELLQTLLDAVEDRGIRIEARQVGAQPGGRLAQLLGDARQLVGGPRERRVVVAPRSSTRAASPACATAPEPSSGLSNSAASRAASSSTSR